MALLLGTCVLTACKQDPSGPMGKGGSPHLAPARCGNGKCETDRKEDCAGCPVDCGRCDGCQTSLASGCFNCKCQACVCAKVPSCCGRTGTWGPECVAACKKGCGGCGVGAGPTPPQPGSPDITTIRWKCGDGKCQVDIGEDCGVCSKDCGQCDGCQRRFVAGCQECSCEECVCKMLPSCCKSRWEAKCVAACKTCGSCKGGSATPKKPQ